MAKPFALLLFSLAATSLADTALVDKGKPVSSIVCAADSLPKTSEPSKSSRKMIESDEALAVRTLVEWVSKISDAQLPIATQPIDGLTPIYIGQAAVDAGLKLTDIPSPTREGLRITVDRQSILIGGQSGTATLKAVCRFLEELGCRYFMDTPLGEVFPRNPTLSVKPLRLTDKPGMAWRNPKGPSWNPRLWKAWNGAGGEPFGHSHSWSNYVKPSDFQQHPEFFALSADGQRKNNGWLCTSNPELRRHFAEGVLRAIENGTANPSLSPTDGRAYCQCADCKAQDDPTSIEPSSGTVSISNRYLDFFDSIGKTVRKKYPSSILSFYCYADYTQPPTVQRKLEDNMCAMIAPIRYCRLHPLGHKGCSSREQQVALIDGWSAIASRLGYYNYMYNLADGSLPMFKFSACAKEFPYLADRGLTYMTLEVLSNWHIYGPQIYLSTRLAYHPHADPVAIMEDYWTTFYGPAAGPHMKAYWMGIDAAQQQLDTHAGGFFGLARVFTPTFIARCNQHIENAMKAAGTDETLLRRIDIAHDGLKTAKDYHAISAAMASGDFPRAKSIYDALVERLTRLVEVGVANREYGSAYLKRFLLPAIEAGLQATAPANTEINVLPDQWKFATDDSNNGEQQGFHQPQFTDSSWRSMATHSAPLDAQGIEKNSVLWYRTNLTIKDNQSRHSLFFSEVDGKTQVFVNGKAIPIPDKYRSIKKAGTADTASPETPVVKPRVPFELDISDAVTPGKNSLAVKVDHTQITELSLGGILRPVLLLHKKP